MTSVYLRSDNDFLLSHCLFQPYWAGVISLSHTHTLPILFLFFEILKGNGELKKEVVGRGKVLLSGREWAAAPLVLQPCSALQGAEWLRSPHVPLRFLCSLSTLPSQRVKSCSVHVTCQSNWTSSKLNPVQRWILVSINTHKIILWLFIEGVGLGFICFCFIQLY